MRLPAGDAQLVQIVDAALVAAAQRAGPWLVCRPGCTQCCHGAFAINELDALRLHAGIEALRSADPAAADAIQARASAWLAEFGPDFPGDSATGLLGESDQDQARFGDFANDAPCPALNPSTGLCDVYPWRPMTCRVFGPPVRMAQSEIGQDDALGCCELCFVGADPAEIAACEMPLPHELEARLVEETRQHGQTLVAFALLR